MSVATWHPQGVAPEHGKRYEFEDFVGARFEATFDRYLSVPMEGTDGQVGPGLRLEFLDRGAFETNLPIRFRDCAAGSGGDTTNG